MKMLSNLNIIKAEFYNFAFIIKIIFTTIFSLIVFLIFINVIVILSILKMQENDALLVNIAGRQRMLSQKMSKNIFFI